MEVNTVMGGAATNAAQGASGRAQISQKEFMKLLVAELSNQDPLKPMENQQFVQQLASLQQLESSAALTDGIRDLVRLQQLSSASSLLGREVVGVDADGGFVSGKVERVATEGNQIVLVVNGQSVPLSGISEVLPATE